MSRLAAGGSLTPLSSAALRAMLSPDSDDDLIILLTITGTGISEPIRLADNYTQRISETADDVVYGVMSRGDAFTFLPLQITLPSEEATAAPQFSITINDVTRWLTPVIRQINDAPSVLMELVLVSAPDVVEASFLGFKMGAIGYNANTVTAEMTVESLAIEPFPSHTFTPAVCPGIF